MVQVYGSKKAGVYDSNHKTAGWYSRRNKVLKIAFFRLFFGFFVKTLLGLLTRIMPGNAHNQPSVWRFSDTALRIRVLTSRQDAAKK